MRRVPLLAVVAFCVWMQTAIALAQGSVTINSDWTLVSSRRVTRTEFEYTYRATATNSGSAAAIQVTATARSLVATTQVIDGALAFGTIPAGATTGSTDTFVLRVDRAQPFSRAQIQWDIAVGAPPTGVLLEGPPAADALGAVTTVDLITGVPPSEISIDANGRQVARTELLLKIAAGATVSEVNAVLVSHGARITAMTENTPFLLVRVTDPGTLAGLDSLVAELEGTPAIEQALRAYFPALDTLPLSFTPPTLVGFSLIDHLLGIRVPAAWNARNALQGAQAPTLLIADDFGAGPPQNPPFAAATNAADYLTTTWTDGHGYHVLGTVAADLIGVREPVGLYPSLPGSPLAVRVVDTGGGFTFPAIEERLIQALVALTNLGRRVVVNTSLGFVCDSIETVVACNVPNARLEAMTWVSLVRATNLEGRFLHVTTAGNVRVPGDDDARTSSPFAAAALLPLPFLEPNLGNTIVVENAAASTTPPYAPQCRSAGSKAPGHLAAVGTQVASYIGPSAAGVANGDGTSFASPQVAALAAYVWALDPTLSPAQLKQLLIDTARAPTPPAVLPTCTNAPLAPVVDAYAALLRADRAEALTPAGSPDDAPARSAILDVATSSGAGESDGVFDGGDLARRLQGFEESPDVSSPAASGCGGYDWSRYDLNGDGRTGRCETAPLDLTIDAALGSVTQVVAGAEMSFDEGRVSDEDALCYYAFSPLYVGDEAERDALLRGRNMCGFVDGMISVAEWESPNLTASEEREEPVRNPDGSWGWRTYVETYYWEMVDPTELGVAAAGSGDLFAVWTEPRSIAVHTCGCVHYHPSEGVPDPGVPHTLNSSLITSHTYAIRAARLAPGQAVPAYHELQVKTTATREGSSVVPIAVTANPRGDAIAVWIVSPQWRDTCCEGQIAIAGEDEVWAALYLKESGWTTPALIESGGTSSMAPRVSLDAERNATVVWQTSNPQRTTRLLMGKRLSAGSAWGATETLASDICDRLFELDASPRGEGVVVWSKGTSVVGRRYDASSGWSSEAVIGTTQSCVKALVDMDELGNGVVVGPTSSGYWLRRLDKATGWGSVASFQPPRSGELVDVALANDGRLALLGHSRVYTGPATSQNTLWSAHYDDAAVAWAPSTVIADFNSWRGGFAAASYLGVHNARVGLSAPFGLLPDSCGNLTAWGAYVSREDSSSDETFTVAASYYSAATGSWGPSEVLYSMDNGGKYLTSALSPGRSTAIAGSDGRCGELALAGLQVDLFEAPNEYMSLEWSIGVSRLGVPRQ